MELNTVSGSFETVILLYKEHHVTLIIVIFGCCSKFFFHLRIHAPISLRVVIIIIAELAHTGTNLSNLIHVA